MLAPPKPEARPPITHDRPTRGRVVRKDPKGYGFIRPDDRSQDIFFPFKHIRKHCRDVRPGDMVLCYTAMNTKKDGLLATEVWLENESRSRTRTPSPDRNGKRSGIVARISDRGFGFITLDNSRQEAFFHMKDVHAESILPGDKVTCKTKLSDKVDGGLDATQVWVERRRIEKSERRTRSKRRSRSRSRRRRNRVASPRVASPRYKRNMHTQNRPLMFQNAHLRDRPNRTIDRREQGQEFVGRIKGFDEDNFAYVESLDSSKSWLLRESFFVGSKFEDLCADDVIGLFADPRGGTIRKAWLEQCA